MRKRFSAIIALLLCVCMLGGCGAVSEFTDGVRDALTPVFPGEGESSDILDALDKITDAVGHTEDDVYTGQEGYTRTDAVKPMIKFSEMEYVRPDLDAVIAHVEEAVEELDNGAEGERAMELVERSLLEHSDFSTMYTIASIRSDADLSDEFYADERAWLETNAAVYEQSMEDLYYAIGRSSYGEELEDEYFYDGFLEEYSDEENAFYTDEIVDLMAQESELMAEYRQICASETITSNGVEYDVWDYIYSAEDYDQYIARLYEYIRKYDAIYSDVYIRLIKVRAQLAEAAGYSSYEEYQYDYYYERDYGPDDTAAFIDSVRQYIVPVYERLEREDVYYNMSISKVSENKALDTVRSGVNNIGGRLSEAFMFMEDYELFDIAYSENKFNSSYETYIQDYQAPYLIVNPQGDSNDILTLSHEFGHFADAYINYNTYETLDLAECYSQALEYLITFYLDGVLSSRKIDELRSIKLYDTAQTYVQQASFAAFEHDVYSIDPDALTTEKLDEISLKYAQEFGYCDDGFEEYYAKSWFSIVHFFEAPFYAISYPVSCDIAMQVYEAERDNSGKGVELYWALLDSDHVGFVECVESCGFESPLDPIRAQKVAQDVSEFFWGE